MNAKEIIARRIAKELWDGAIVNLGIGLPTLVANYVPEGTRIYLQSENGIIGMGRIADDSNRDPELVNAGGAEVTVEQGASFFDSATSFAIIRGGHVDLTVLGALQVDGSGNLASHIVPGKMVPGMGGAMDLVVGSKKVIIASTHTAKEEAPKILKQITLPATGIGCVDMIVTELAVFEMTPQGLTLTELHPDTDLETVRRLTQADFIVAEQLKTMMI
ncbi:MAG: 3-oxoacid CoA-transferase subunit B [Oscillospiraceae bacterium]|nr:3-oxoacid CoA-transferase subunit B [Oscillospiraceae bacterium]